MLSRVSSIFLVIYLPKNLNKLNTSLAEKYPTNFEEVSSAKREAQSYDGQPRCPCSTPSSGTHLKNANAQASHVPDKLFFALALGFHCPAAALVLRTQTCRNFPLRLGLITLVSAIITLWREKNGAHFILVLHSITMPIRVIWGGRGCLLKLRESLAPC